MNKLSKSPGVIDLRRLRYVVEAARVGSVTAAAQSLSISQPALTRSIAELEQDVGFPIFFRLHRGIALTEDGEEFVNRARVIIDDVATLGREVQSKSNDPVGRLRIGFSPAGYIHSVREVMAAFAKQYAGVALETVTGMPQTVCNRLFRGELDMLIGLSSYFDQWPEIETEELTELQFAFMVRQKHPLVGKNNITAKDLSGFPLVLPESADPGITNIAAITSLKPHYVTDEFSLGVSLLNNTDAVYPLHTSQQVIDLMSEDFHMIRGAINVRETHIAVGFMKHRIKTTAAKVFTDMVVTKFKNGQLEKIERLY